MRVKSFMTDGSHNCQTVTDTKRSTTNELISARAMANLLAVDLHDCVALGTLKLSGLRLVNSDTHADDVDFSGPSASTGRKLWLAYTPGIFEEPQIATGKLSHSPAKQPSLKRSRADAESQASNIPLASATKGKGKIARLPRSPTVKELDRLITQLFLRLEYSTVTQDACGEADLSVLFRVYAVPLDLPSLNDRLDQTGYYAKYRSETVKNHAARIFNKLFHNLHYSASEWRGDGLDEVPRWLLYRSEVCHRCVRRSCAYFPLATATSITAGGV